MYFTTMALLHHRPCRMIHESGTSTRVRPTWLPVAGNSPVYGPGWEFPLVVAQGVAGKPGLFLPGRTVYFCPLWERVRACPCEGRGGEGVHPINSMLLDY